MPVHRIDETLGQRTRHPMRHIGHHCVAKCGAAIRNPSDIKLPGNLRPHLNTTRPIFHLPLFHPPKNKPKKILPQPTRQPQKIRPNPLTHPNLNTPHPIPQPQPQLQPQLTWHKPQHRSTLQIQLRFDGADVRHCCDRLRRSEAGEMYVVSVLLSGHVCDWVWGHAED